MSQTGRLAAVLAADVAGYSRLIGEDEEGTLDRLKALRREIIDPKIAGHHGRIVKTTGDGILIEFSSVVDALAPVRCPFETAESARRVGSSRGGPGHCRLWRALFPAAWRRSRPVARGSEVFGGHGRLRRSPPLPRQRRIAVVEHPMLRLKPGGRRAAAGYAPAPQRKSIVAK
jgi:hypothetical protein